jgi:hypothetical protein
VVELDATRLKTLLSLLPEEEYYVSEEAARDAVLRRLMFHIVDLESGWKMDLVVRKNRSFSEEKFRGGGRAPSGCPCGLPVRRTVWWRSWSGQHWGARSARSGMFGRYWMSKVPVWIRRTSFTGFGN